MAAIHNLVLSTGIGPSSAVIYLHTLGLDIGVATAILKTSRHSVSPRDRRLSVSPAEERLSFSPRERRRT